MIAALLIVAFWAFLIVLGFGLCHDAKQGDKIAREALDRRERGPHRAKGGGWRL